MAEGSISRKKTRRIVRGFEKNSGDKTTRKSIRRRRELAEQRRKALTNEAVEE